MIYYFLLDNEIRVIPGQYSTQTSTKGTPLINHDGFKYGLAYTSRKGLRLQCTSRVYRKGVPSCPARALLEKESGVLIIQGVHNHSRRNLK